MSQLTKTILTLLSCLSAPVKLQEGQTKCLLTYRFRFWSWISSLRVADENEAVVTTWFARQTPTSPGAADMITKSTSRTLVGIGSLFPSGLMPDTVQENVHRRCWARQGQNSKGMPTCHLQAIRNQTTAAMPRRWCQSAWSITMNSKISCTAICLTSKSTVAVACSTPDTVKVPVNSSRRAERRDRNLLWKVKASDRVGGGSSDAMMEILLDLRCFSFYWNRFHQSVFIYAFLSKFSEKSLLHFIWYFNETWTKSITWWYKFDKNLILLMRTNW